MINKNKTLELLNYINKPMSKESIGILYATNGIRYDKCELFNDFILSLLMLIFDTYMGDDIMTPSDQEAHFKWCWNKNIENFKVNQKRYKDANPEKRRAQVVRWKKEHPEEAKARSNHNTSMRRSRKRHATPPWLNKDMKLQIRRIYAGCPAGWSY